MLIQNIYCYRIYLTSYYIYYNIYGNFNINIENFNRKRNINKNTLFQMDQITSSHKLKLHDCFQMAGLSPDDFDPKYNKVWDNY